MEMQRDTALRSKRSLENELEEVQQHLDEMSKMKREAEERCTGLQREKTELQLQVEDYEEEVRRNFCSPIENVLFIQFLLLLRL